jgi:RimJ/RimL family protein N-acetyltransferase
MGKIFLLKKLEAIDKSFLEEIYIESEFIDPIDEIYKKFYSKAEENLSTPFIITMQNETIAFFTIESTNFKVSGKNIEKGVYWLESFFMTKNYIGKGLSKTVVKKIVKELPNYFPSIDCLNLTVNLRNKVAQNVYKKSGFEDTLEKYYGGPAGPQFIYKYKMKC